MHPLRNDRRRTIPYLDAEINEANSTPQGFVRDRGDLPEELQFVLLLEDFAQTGHEPSTRVDLRRRAVTLLQLKPKPIMRKRTVLVLVVPDQVPDLRVKADQIAD